mmetsp:Transcript_1195/g.905  ORF Transcript_1195/g.905 Transcript_1195/m.905 type:complete len:109 (-) Transcript_1195:27-353(-)
MAISMRTHFRTIQSWLSGISITSHCSSSLCTSDKPSRVRRPPRKCRTAIHNTGKPRQSSSPAAFRVLPPGPPLEPLGLHSKHPKRRPFCSKFKPYVPLDLAGFGSSGT